MSKLSMKFLKEWSLTSVVDTSFDRLMYSTEKLKMYQRWLDGGICITRTDGRVEMKVNNNAVWWVFGTPARAVKFAAALNKLRRPLRILRKELDDVWAARVKERDAQTCVLCGIVGAKIGGLVSTPTAVVLSSGEPISVKVRAKQDSLTAHHWLKNKARAGMARWARPCGVAVHFAEHIHLLHENPCWADLEPIYRHVAIMEGEEAIKATLALVKVPPTEERVRMLWFEMCPAKIGEVKP